MRASRPLAHLLLGGFVGDGDGAEEWRINRAAELAAPAAMHRRRLLGVRVVADVVRAEDRKE